MSAIRELADALARKAIDVMKFGDLMGGDAPRNQKSVADLFEAVIESAMSAEREACAVVCDRYASEYYCDAASEVADRIRSRGAS